jgi:hypothetical protein
MSSRCPARHRGTLMAVLTVIVASCGDAPSATAVSAPVLPAGAVTGLTGTRHQVTAQALVEDAPATGLEADLRTWGFMGGTEADYRGSGTRFSVVTSRTLVFASHAGARAYVSMVGAHASAYAGGAAGRIAISSLGRLGFLLTAGSCGCATEVPQLLAVVSNGGRVTWLAVTGRRVTPAAVERLLAMAP